MELYASKEPGAPGARPGAPPGTPGAAPGAPAGLQDPDAEDQERVTERAASHGVSVMPASNIPYSIVIIVVLLSQQ